MIINWTCAVSGMVSSYTIPEIEICSHLHFVLWAHTRFTNLCFVHIHKSWSYKKHPLTKARRHLPNNHSSLSGSWDSWCDIFKQSYFLVLILLGNRLRLNKLVSWKFGGLILRFIFGFVTIVGKIHIISHDSLHQLTKYLELNILCISLC